MQWTKFLHESPSHPHQRTLSKSKHLNISNSKSKPILSSLKKQNKSSSNISLCQQKKSSISDLFVKQIKQSNIQKQYIKQVKQAILEIRDIQKQQLQINRQTLKLLINPKNVNKNKKDKDKGSSKKKNHSTTTGLEQHFASKFKDLDKIKSDLTLMLKKSRSCKKTHKKSQSIIKMLR